MAAKKPMSDAEKKKLIKKTGTGAVRKAGESIINRKKQLEDAMKAAGAKRKAPAKKKPTKYA